MKNAINAAVLVVFKRGGTVLVGRRINTSYADGLLCPPGGRVEAGEPFSSAAIREVLEEVGVVLKPADIKPAHIMYCRHVLGFEWIEAYFVVDSWDGEPVNNEQNKCAGLLWVPLNALPDDVVPEVIQGLRCIQDGVFYSEFFTAG